MSEPGEEAERGSDQKHLDARGQSFAKPFGEPLAQRQPDLTETRHDTRMPELIVCVNEVAIEWCRMVRVSSIRTSHAAIYGSISRVDTASVRRDVRTALSRLVAQGPRAIWLPEAQPLLKLPAVRQRLEEGEGADAALLFVLRDAVDQMGASQHGTILRIVLALDPEYEALSVRARREIAGKAFRGGRKAVQPGTIRQHHEPKALDHLAELLVPVVDETHEPGPRAGAATSRPRLEWHPTLHVKWASEQLYYWRIGFPLYDREAARLRIAAVMRRAGVRSWAMYELFGPSDVLVRGWLPAHQSEVEDALATVFHDSPGMVIESFAVSAILTHWPWVGHTGEMVQPSPAHLAQRLSDDEIEQMMRDPKDGQAAHLLTTVQPADGIAVVVVVDPPRPALSAAGSASLTERVTAIFAKHEHAKQVSIYRGMGFGAYLIEAVIPAAAFNRIDDVILSPLRQLLNPIGSRTTTTSLASLDPMTYEETMLSSGVRAPEASARELLECDEGPRLEIKATAFVDIDARRSGALKAPGHETVSRAADSLLRTIAGMLNAHGGTILVGAIEEERRRSLLRSSSAEPSAGAPRIGRYLVCGIEHELDRGRDSYERRLLEMCHTMLEPSPSGFVTMRFEPIEDRTVCIVDVRATPKSGEGATWVYHRPARSRYPRFYVREGASTRELAGSECDRYKLLRSGEPDARSLGAV